MPFTDDGLFYETRGSGLPCLAIHGGLGVDHTSMRSFGPMEDVLRITYYDQRGNGRSTRVGIEGLTMEGLADDAASLIRDVVGSPAIVLGHSYGGFVGQELAIRHPEAVRGLVLVDTTPGQPGVDEPAAQDGPPLPAEALQLLGTFPTTDEEMGRLLMELFPLVYLKRLSVEAVAPLLAGTVFSATAMIRGFEVLSQWSSVDRLGEFRGPVLLLWGRDDVMCSLPQAGRIQRMLPQAELAVFDDSGHFPWLESPSEFFAALRDWVARQA